MRKTRSNFIAICTVFISLQSYAQSSIFNLVDTYGATTTCGWGPGDFSLSHAMDIHTASGRLFTSGYLKVNVFSIVGNNIVHLAENSTSISNMYGLKVRQSDGRIFTMNYNTGLMRVFTTSGGTMGLVTTTGNAGTGPRQISNPTSLEIDNQNRVYITQFSTVRAQISVFSLTGNSLSFIAEYGILSTAGNNAFNRPYSVKVRNNLIYVADQTASKIKVLTLNGSNLGYYGEFTVTGYPTRIDFDTQGRLFYTDNFTLNECRILTGSGTNFVYADKFNSFNDSPYGMVLSASGVVFYSTFNTCRLRMFKECSPRTRITGNSTHQTVCGTNQALLNVTATGAGLS